MKVDRLIVFAFCALGLLILLAVGITCGFHSQYREHMVKLYTDIKNEFFYSLWIRSYIQSFLSVSITCGIFFNAVRLDPSSEPFAKKAVFFGLAFILFAVVPGVFIRLLRKYRNELDEPEVRKQFGSLYLGVRLDRTARVYCVVEFLVVRFVFVFITFMLQ